MLFGLASLFERALVGKECWAIFESGVQKDGRL